MLSFRSNQTDQLTGIKAILQKLIFSQHFSKDLAFPVLLQLRSEFFYNFAIFSMSVAMATNAEDSTKTSWPMEDYLRNISIKKYCMYTVKAVRDIFFFNFPIESQWQLCGATATQSTKVIGIN